MSNTIYRRKSALDRFYTHPDVARECWARTVSLFDTKSFDLFLEPSAGNGSFFRLLPHDARRGIDLDPRDAGIERGDFLAIFGPSEERVLTIGNPPFGRVAATAVRFFNRAASFSTVIAFILPRTFRKISVQNKLDARFHLKAEWDLPKNAFLLDGSPYDVPCCFQIWEKRASPRARPTERIDNHVFEFASKDRADFAVRRVGGKAGKCSRDLATAAEVSHYFLKLKDPKLDRRAVMDFIDGLDLSKIVNATAGVRSLSKPEFVESFFTHWRQTPPGQTPR